MILFFLQFTFQGGLSPARVHRDNFDNETDTEFGKILGENNISNQKFMETLSMMSKVCYL